jgi:hypothetical protein
VIELLYLCMPWPDITSKIYSFSLREPHRKKQHFLLRPLSSFTFQCLGFFLTP